MFQSINDARYTMWATVIPRLDSASTSTGAQAGPQVAGHFERTQDPDTNQINTAWVVDADSSKNTGFARFDIPCYARGYTNLGFRSSANREVYVKGEYNLIESVQFDYPLWVDLNHQTLVTNIRSSKEDQDFLWLYDDTSDSIVWEVQGTTPVTDPFGKPLRYTTVLKRSEIQ